MNPEILFGKPVVKGTRIPVDLILEKMADGNDAVELLNAYPALSPASLKACLLFAADSVKHEKVVSVS